MHQGIETSSGGDQGGQMEQAQVGVEQVYATLSASLSMDNQQRGAAEAQLRRWESDAAPAFIGSLCKVMAEVNGVPEVRGEAADHTSGGAGRPGGWGASEVTSAAD